jgi:hypothetical protein
MVENVKFMTIGVYCKIPREVNEPGWGIIVVMLNFCGLMTTIFGIRKNI